MARHGGSFDKLSKNKSFPTPFGLSLSKPWWRANGPSFDKLRTIGEYKLRTIGEYRLRTNGNGEAFLRERREPSGPWDAQDDRKYKLSPNGGWGRIVSLERRAAPRLSALRRPSGDRDGLTGRVGIITRA